FCQRDQPLRSGGHFSGPLGTRPFKEVNRHPAGAFWRNRNLTCSRAGQKRRARRRSGCHRRGSHGHPTPAKRLIMELKFILESILFSAQQPLTAKELKGLLTTAAQQEDAPTAKTFKRTSADEITTV